MSHKHEDIICPNCGYHATENYCAKCGQETHLHEDSFWSLIMHFIGHYFHYDSKFWQTLKALWFSPGKLTIAYWNKQRMRYIAPISLYIFISAVFFLVSSLLPNNKFIKDTSVTSETDSTQLSKNKRGVNTYSFSSDFGTKETKELKDKSSDKKQEEIKEKLEHNIPKVFFFMIPLMAFVLQLLFLKRKDLFYVNHIIYSLHFHSFWFSILLLDILYPFKTGSSVASLIIIIVSAIYFITALKNTYHISWVRSALYSIITFLVYVVFVAAALTALSIIIYKWGV